jgi:hypothetical protein
MTDERRECFLGLIAPIGVDLDAVSTALEQALQHVSYGFNEVRLTDIFRENSQWYNIDFSTEIDRYKKYIAAGDRLCKDTGRRDILSLYGIANLAKYNDRAPLKPVPNQVVHVFRQLKRVEEIQTLKEVYG